MTEQNAFHKYRAVAKKSSLPPVRITFLNNKYYCACGRICSTTQEKASHVRWCKYSKRADEDDIECQICHCGDSLEKDRIVLCDRCNLGFHQTCYEIHVIPSGPWFCRYICLVVDSHAPLQKKVHKTKSKEYFRRSPDY